MLAIAAVAMVLGLAFGQVELARFISIGGVRTLVASAGLFMMLWVAGVVVAMTRRRIERPTVTLVRMIRWRKRWIMRGALFLVMIVLFVRCFSSFKIAIATLNPFWADPWLAELDYRTFGEDPWVLTHAIFGNFGTLVLDRIYLVWFFAVPIVMGWVCFANDPKLQIRGLMSYVLSWSILGGATALGLSSVGPCFYEQFYGSERFAPLMDRLDAISAQHEIMAFRTMNFLIVSLEKENIGGGISAMPSLHVGMALLTFLCVYCYTNSWLLKVAAGLFAIAITIGSVHLGWHYAWDGIVSIIGVSAIWWGSGRFVDWIERRELSASPAVAIRVLPATT